VQEEVFTMSYPNTAEALSTPHQQDQSNGYSLSESEKAQLRATSLYLIRSIVERHGGTAEIDLGTNTINIDVPDAEETLCAQEIEEQVARMCH
jgi:hypothetical protein